jgi:DNA-binding SARP family transcriptional activator
MAHLSIRLLGSMRVTLDDEPVTRFETEKARVLLAYLAVEADRPQRRDLLAEMLWPERPAGAANANLRHTLTGLRRAIDDISAARSADRETSPPFLLATRQTIQLNSASDIWVDVHAFTGLLQPTHPPSQPDFPSLEEAVSLCRGAFCEDLSASGCAALQEWLLLTRQQLARPGWLRRSDSARRGPRSRGPGRRDSGRRTR